MYSIECIVFLSIVYLSAIDQALSNVIICRKTRKWYNIMKEMPGATSSLG